MGRLFFSLLLVLTALISPATALATAETGCFCYYNLTVGGSDYCISTNVTAGETYCREACAAIYDGTAENPGDDGIYNADLTTYSSYEDQTTFEAENCTANAEPAETTTATVAPTTPTVAYSVPSLSIDIPEVDFVTPVLTSGVQSSNFIGTYVSGVYKYLIGFAIVVAIVMMMIGGLQYVVGATGGQVEKAKARIKNAVEGFVLLLFVATILFTVNPQLTFFRSLELLNVEQIKLSESASGPEGEASTSSGISSLSEIPEPYKTIIADAKSSGTCNMTGTMRLASPTGRPPNTGKHHWFSGGAEGKWKNVYKLDYAATWANPILAPFDGIATYIKKGTVADPDDQCGNTIYLEGSGAKIAICHAKDFFGADGDFKQNRTVKQGEVMGHLGGNCCVGQIPPENWAAFSTGPDDPSWCNVSGTACTDPTRSETCSCQNVAQAGNTTGPHVHITWYEVGGNLLACLKED